MTDDTKDDTNGVETVATEGVGITVTDDPDTDDNDGVDILIARRMFNALAGMAIDLRGCWEGGRRGGGRGNEVGGMYILATSVVSTLK